MYYTIFYRALWGCLGALIAPRFVLTSADCASRALSQQSNTTVDFWTSSETRHTGVLVRTRPSSRTVSTVTLERGVQLADEDESTRSGVAVLELSKAAIASPVSLAGRWCDAERRHESGVLRVFSIEERDAGLVEIVGVDAVDNGENDERCEARELVNQLLSAGICVTTLPAVRIAAKCTPDQVRHC